MLLDKPVMLATEQPAPPEIPTSWQHAWFLMNQRFERVVTSQSRVIIDLTSRLTDQAGLIAAAVKGRADLAASITVDLDKLSARIDGEAKTITAVCETITGLSGAIDDLQKMIVDRVNDQAAVDSRITNVSDSIMVLNDTVTGTAEALAGVALSVSEQRAHLDTIQVDFDFQRARLDAVAVVVDKHGDRLDSMEVDVVAASTTAAFDRLDDVAGTVQALIAGRAEDHERITAVAALVEDYAATASGEDHALCDKIVALTVRVDGEDSTVAALVDRVGEIKTHADRLADQFAERIDGVDGTLVDLTRVVAKDRDTFAGQVHEIATTVNGLTSFRIETTAAIEDAAVQVAAVVSAQGRLTDDLSGLAFRAEQDTVRISNVEEFTTGFVAQGVNIGRDLVRMAAAIDDHAATVASATEEAREANRRVTIALDQMPAGFMIDQDGVLNRINRGGDLSQIGTVVAVSKDGRDAPEIVAAKIEGDRLVFTRSDRTEFGCAVPMAPATVVPPVEEIDPRTLGYLSKDPVIKAVQVADMLKMRADGKKYKEIAEKYGISDRTAARTIKRAQDER